MANAKDSNPLDTRTGQSRQAAGTPSRSGGSAAASRPANGQKNGQAQTGALQAGDPVYVSTESFTDEFYQVTPQLLMALPETQMPIDLYLYKENIQAVVPIYTAGTRFAPRERDHIVKLCRGECIFVSRSQRDVYTDYIMLQLDLILLDKNLRRPEIIRSVFKALIRRTHLLYGAPTEEHMQGFLEDISVFAQAVARDLSLLTDLLGHLHEHNAPEHKTVNAGLVGTAIYVKAKQKNLTLESLKRVACAFFLHDLGMTRIPKFILDKDKQLRYDEVSRIRTHPHLSVEVLQKLGIQDPQVHSCAAQHHERMDGSGYPLGLEGGDIGLLGRICALADSYSAMIANKVYSPARRPVEAAVELYRDAKRYDSRLAALLIDVLR